MANTIETTTATDAAELKRLSELFEEVNGQAQTLYGGFLRVVPTTTSAAAATARTSTSASVQLVLGKRDLVNNSVTKYERQFHVHGLGGGRSDGGATPTVHAGLVPAAWDHALISVSPSKRWVVTLKLDKGTDPSAPAEGVFSVFEEGVLSHSFKAPKSLHGGIYAGEREGGIAWSHDETRIAYVAERKQPETLPFFENANQAAAKKDDDKPASPTVLPGTKFEQEDDWGEQYVGKKTGAIFLATLATGKIQELKGLPSNLTCADVQFTPDDEGLVFAGTETDSPRRLGIIYCYNRPITLYHAIFDKEDPQKDCAVSKIAFTATDAGAEAIASIRSPRFSPDGRHLAFLATRDVVTHNTCSLLAVLDWATKDVATIIDVVDDPEDGYTSRPETAFNGLFVGALSRRCWSSDGRFIFFETQLGARQVWKYVEVATKTLRHPTFIEGPGIAQETILDRVDDWLLVSTSSPVRPASVYLVHMDLATGQYLESPVAILDQRGRSKFIGDWKVLPVPTAVSDKPAAAQRPMPVVDEALAPHLLPLISSAADFEATVWLPKAPPPASTGAYPVILDVHGGPHGNSPVMYRVMYEYLAALGFAIVSVNYRGSTGYGRRALESLVGRVGTQDVYDCHYGLVHVLETSGLPLDPNRVHCSGGSHGGFLVAHLIAQFPGYYRSTVARNPVVNITSQFFTSDIPDWGLAVTGVARFDAVHTTQALQRAHRARELPPLEAGARAQILAKWWHHSPMSIDLTRVTTPVLFGIGGKDRRVPPTQGLELRDALGALGVETRTLWYPDDCHPLDTLAAFGDFSVNWGAWVLRHNA